ncbi:MAG: hypothetical protein HQM03_19375 [Magnetococcales bacterium]|nr:hypothetical protein [Magnetococcales bacterium]
MADERTLHRPADTARRKFACVRNAMHFNLIQSVPVAFACRAGIEPSLAALQQKSGEFSLEIATWYAN